MYTKIIFYSLWFISCFFAGMNSGLVLGAWKDRKSLRRHGGYALAWALIAIYFTALISELYKEGPL